MKNEININYDAGIMVKVSKNGSSSKIQVLDDKVLLQVVNSNIPANSKLDISNEEILFDVDDIEIASDTTVVEIFESLELNLSGNKVKISDELDIINYNTEYNIGDLSNIKASKIIFE